MTEVELRKRKIVFAIPPLVGVVLIGTCVKFTTSGFDHIDPWLQRQSAEIAWANGDTGRALREFALAIGMALEAGARWTVAGPYISEMRVLRSNGRLNEALAQCIAAVQILDGYDDEGGVSYQCASIEEAMERQAP